ncbi:hypothetical protein X798_00859 [Onchocerca flexuosa]|uniref:Tubulin-specific chaperone A n=1 Tax=Onchocerca flexuosa TaxID=387005 RepID=A0A238C4E6_9BILA|nr:hypothetical protein X798_00859 [Onchocerca flexuosa]
MADPTVLKDIAIKTGVVKRLIKELCYYEKEEEKLMNKLQTMQAGGDVDEHILKKQVELLQVIGEHEALLQDTSEYIAAAEQIKVGTEECLKIKEGA